MDMDQRGFLILSTGLLKIDSFKELLDNEKEIVKRINKMPNGGNLFLINAFMLFEDIGVQLNDKVKKEIISIEPSLSSISSLPYNAQKRNNQKHFRVHVKGLFKRTRK